LVPTSDGLDNFVGISSCDLAQGYFIARAMPLADFMAFLDRRERKTG
jgi:EAL domain-containing protein (putative c-di-GMP-specific phosphodiesterase class I)